MKKLINKANPQIRISAPEIGTGTRYYFVGNVGYHKHQWTLVEEEPTCKESLQVEPTEGIRGKKEEIPSMDLEKEIDKEWKKCNPTDEGMGVETANIHIEAFDMIARHFYELGLNARI